MTIRFIRSLVAGFTAFVTATLALVGAAFADNTTAYVPDSPGSRVYIFRFDQAVEGSIAQKIVALPTNCKPNSVAANSVNLYIACSSYFTSGIDSVLVYDLATRRFKQPIVGRGTDNRQYFNGLIAMAFDLYGNLWISSINNNLLLRVNANALATQDPPFIDRSVVDSPGAPVGFGFDGSDNSMWVAGQFSNGIVVNFPATANPSLPGYSNSVNQKGNFLGDGVHGNALNLTPVFCIAQQAGICPQAGTANFDNIEGLAVFDHSIFVSNNGGDHPTGTLIKLIKSGTTLVPSVIGGTIGQPFSCPGGLFPGTKLWVNEEAYGRGGAGQPATACGSNGGIAGDQGDQVGRVLSFTVSMLRIRPTTPRPDAFGDWRRVRTGSPGFGGIFIREP